MRFMVGACQNEPEKMKQLFLMSYGTLLKELDFYYLKKNTMEINCILKEMFKHMKTIECINDKKITLFTVEEANTLIGRLQGIYTLIDKTTTDAVVESQKKNLDDEDME